MKRASAHAQHFLFYFILSWISHTKQKQLRLFTNSILGALSTAVMEEPNMNLHLAQRPLKLNERFSPTREAEVQRPHAFCGASRAKWMYE